MSDPGPWVTVAACMFCDVLDEAVEAAGIYYCPNPLCTGSGGHNHRIPFTDAEGTRVLDWMAYYAEEWVAPTPSLEEAFLRQLVKLAKKYGSDDPRVLSRLRALLTIEGHVGVPESDGGATP
jgi:hypothetical protein